MSGKILAFEELQIIVGKPDQIEHRPAFAPVEARRVHVAMHKPVLVHVGHSTRDLPEDE